jgi:hypothetical protein
VTRLVDADGRILGRVNLVDALCVLFLLGLVPAAYVTWLLFRPAMPRIDSVERSAVTVAEQRIAAGLPIRMKVKVRGEHLAPLLRAQIDNVPAIGFTFETPQSADVIIGENVPFGTHDLIIYDGVQEVARARGAITIVPPPTAPVHAIGSLVQLDESTARNLYAGQRFAAGGTTAAEIVALGDTAPDRSVVKDFTGQVEPQVSGSWRRDAIIALHCEPDPDEAICRIGRSAIGASADALIDVPAASPSLRMRVAGIVPQTPPARATLRLLVAAGAGVSISAGDRDVRWPSIDPRGAVVAAVRRLPGDAVEIEARVGVDRAHSGWRYHGQPIEPGGKFILVTDRYAVTAEIGSLAIDAR